jgi:hypothetical protein
MLESGIGTGIGDITMHQPHMGDGETHGLDHVYEISTDIDKPGLLRTRLARMEVFGKTGPA